MKSYFEYYEGHSLKDLAIELLEITNDEKISIAILSSSKNNESRKDFLKLVVKNYEQLRPDLWICLSSHSIFLIKRVLSLKNIKLAEKLITISEFHKDLGLRIRLDESVINHCYESIIGKYNLDLVRILHNYGFSNFQSIDKSNNVYKTFKIKEKDFNFKNVILKPMEFYEEFVKVGKELSSCTGGERHWNSVLNGSELRFVVIRDSSVVGTILYSFYSMKVYGFERNYSNYTKETIDEISIFLKDKLNLDLTLFKYETHGWGKILKTI